MKRHLFVIVIIVLGCLGLLLNRLFCLWFSLGSSRLCSLNRLCGLCRLGSCLLCSLGSGILLCGRLFLLLCRCRLLIGRLFFFLRLGLIVP